MKVADGKNRATDIANTELLLRIIPSIPSPKAEPFKQIKLLKARIYPCLWQLYLTSPARIELTASAYITPPTPLNFSTNTDIF
jgi:hypothetical protein